MIILGLDISSYQLNGCIIIPGQLLFRQQSLGKSKEIIDRLLLVPEAMHEIADLHEGMGGTSWYNLPRYPDEIVIEDAFGPSRDTDKKLWGTIGAIVATCADFPKARVSVSRTGDWRAELGAKDTKPDGHRAVWEHLTAGPWTHGRELDEHELDACGIALAWKHRLEAMANGVASAGLGLEQ